MCLGVLRIAFAVAVFLGTQFEVAKVGFERLANEGGAVPLCLTGGTIRGHQELLVENDLDCFHGCRLYSTIYSTHFQTNR